MNFKKILRVIFGRTTILAVLLLLQLAVLLGMFKRLSDYSTYFYGGFLILSVSVIVYILNSPTNPNFKIAWIIPLMIFPVVGALFYVYVQLAPGTRLIRRNIDRITEETKDVLSKDEELLAGTVLVGYSLLGPH